MTNKIWAVVPAAGAGKRMQSKVPKQYLKVKNEYIVHHTLSKLASHPHISGVIVALSRNDEWWCLPKCKQQEKIFTCIGGKERSDSVLSALNFVFNDRQVSSNDWVMVHDAARPLIRHRELDALIAQMDKISGANDGCILGVPCRDTMKTVSSEEVVTATVDRSQLWHAQTPQCFRLSSLIHALESMRAACNQVTDESSAMEMLGGKVVVIPGDVNNIKLTFPEDLQFAELFLDEYAGGV